MNRLIDRVHTFDLPFQRKFSFVSMSTIPRSIWQVRSACMCVFRRSTSVTAQIIGRKRSRIAQESISFFFLPELKSWERVQNRVCKGLTLLSEVNKLEEISREKLKPYESLQDFYKNTFKLFIYTCNSQLSISYSVGDYVTSTIK